MEKIYTSFFLQYAIYVTSQWRTPKLQQKLPDRQRKHPASQNIKIHIFLLPFLASWNLIWIHLHWPNSIRI